MIWSPKQQTEVAAMLREARQTIVDIVETYHLDHRVERSDETRGPLKTVNGIDGLLDELGATSVLERLRRIERHNDPATFVPLAVSDAAALTQLIAILAVYRQSDAIITRSDLARALDNVTEPKT